MYGNKIEIICFFLIIDVSKMLAVFNARFYFDKLDEVGYNYASIL